MCEMKKLELVFSVRLKRMRIKTEQYVRWDELRKKYTKQLNNENHWKWRKEEMNDANTTNEFARHFHVLIQ